MSGTIESQLRYHAKHPDTPPPLRVLMLRAIEELRYRAMVIEQRNAEIKRGHDDFVQAITDPENQPSQWGTVTLAMYEKLELDTAAPVPQPAQEPVKFLVNGTRFKLSFDTRGRVSSLWNFMDKLDGRWVALVAAEDDCHLQSTQPIGINSMVEATTRPAIDAAIKQGHQHE